MAPYPPRRVVWAFDRAIVSRGMGMQPFERGRRALELLGKLQAPPGDVAHRPGEYGGVPGLVLTPAGASGPPRVLYLHGGGYCYGSPTTHLGPVAHLARAIGSVVFSADYPLAPENPHPAATEAALSAFDALTDTGAAPALAGDSAGGGLALCAAIAIRDSARPATPGIALISPLADLTNTSESIRRNAGLDALLKPQYVDRVARAYAGGVDRADPAVSPINAELAGLPPVLVHAGSDELLVDEAVELARRLSAAGVDVQSRVWPDMWHDFHVHAGMLRAADEAVGEMGAWLKKRIEAQAASA